MLTKSVKCRIFTKHIVVFVIEFHNKAIMENLRAKAIALLSAASCILTTVASVNARERCRQCHLRVIAEIS